MRFKSRSRALIGSALAASLGLAGLALSASPAMASEATDVVRVAGTTRYGTAADAATSAYPAGSANVILASGEMFPDALAGGGLAGSLDAPILLTQQNTLPADTTAALAELDAETVTILGGTAAVSAAVETALEGLGYTVDRVAGADRFETAALIAEELGGTTAVLANGLRFPDALAISPGAHALELPVLLTTADGLQDDAAGYIDANAVDSVIIVGGTAVVSQATEDALEADGITVTRLAGATRYESSVEIAEFHVTQGFTLAEVVMATGENFADALAGGPYASVMGAPMVLTQTATLSTATSAFLTANCQAIDALSILGGTAAITTAVETAAAAAAQCDGNAAFGSDLSGPSPIAIPASGDVAGQFVSFNGISSTTANVSLLPVAWPDMDPFVMQNGQVFSFLDEDQDNIADGTQLSTTDGRTTHGEHSNPDIYVTSANGVPCDVDEQTCTDIAVNNGSVNVRLDFDSDPSDSAWILVYDDVNGDNVLNLNAQNQPTEPFGLAGPIFTSAGEATLGDCAGDDIYWVDTAQNRIYTMDDDGVYYTYGNTGDTYDYDTSVNLNAAEFEAFLSVGDELYFNDECYRPGGPNDFSLVDQQANMPTGVATATGDFDQNAVDTASNDVRVTWTAPNPANGFVVAYNIYRDGVNIDTVAGATQYVDEDLAPATYQYRVESVTFDGDGTSSLTDQVAATVAAPAPGPLAGAPESLSAVFQDPDNNGVISSGDTLLVTFNESMATPTAGDSIEITDADGTVITVTNGTNATFTLSGNAVTLAIQLTGAPVTVDAGTTAGATYGSAEVTDSTGVTDTVENLEWDLVASTDVTF